MVAANTPSKQSSGRTLWVLLAVALIVLMGVVIYLHVSSLLVEADRAHVESTARSIKVAILQYEQNQGPLKPADVDRANPEDLRQEALASTLFEIIDLRLIDAKIVRRALQDPWGKSYAFRWNDTASEKQIVMVSDGPDGVAGTSDDIVEVVWSGEK